MSETNERASSTAYTSGAKQTVEFKEARSAAAPPDTSSKQTTAVHTVVAPSGVMSATFSMSTRRGAPISVPQDTKNP